MARKTRFDAVGRTGVRASSRRARNKPGSVTRRFTKVFLPVLELHREPVVRPEPVHVLERVVRAAAVGVEEPRQKVVELVCVGKMPCCLASFVLVIRIGTLLDQELRDLDVAVLRGDLCANQSVSRVRV